MNHGLQMRPVDLPYPEAPNRETDALASEVIPWRNWKSWDVDENHIQRLDARLNYENPSWMLQYIDGLMNQGLVKLWPPFQQQMIPFYSFLGLTTPITPSECSG